MQDFEDWDTDTDQVRTEPPYGRQTLVAILYYPDILDLRLAGYELERFENLLVTLDSASFKKALQVSRLLHRGDASPIWNTHRANQIELLVLDSIHEYGLAQVPQLLRKILGRVYEGEMQTLLTIDLVEVFYWACLAEVARDYAWRDPRLSEWADYLNYPVKSIFRI
ncbi:MAG: hypothetical protein ACKOFA_05850 [Rhodoluna sp.]